MRKRIFSKMLKKLNNTIGSSLAEMVLCAALVGMISVIVALGVSYSYRVTAEIQSEAYADTVSKMILDKVSGVIAQAITPGSGDAKKKICISEDNHFLAFETAGSSPVIIFATNDTVPLAKGPTSGEEEWPISSRIGAGSGYLNLYYCYIKTAGDNIDPSLWSFSKDAYMGYRINELTFNPVIHNNKLIIQIKLKIQRPEGVEHSEMTTVCCYNVKTETDNIEDVIKVITGDNFPGSYVADGWNTSS